LFLYNRDANQEFVPEYEVTLVGISYRTIDANGNFVEASGAIIFPVGAIEYPLLSYHHFTQTKRKNVASEDLLNAIDGIIAASIGYIVSEPDYLGFGVSEILHPYHHEETSASCSIDMLKATKQYCEKNKIKFNEQLFLAGYSQGGYVTMATHKELEKNFADELIVTASAPMAGAHDLYGTALKVTQTENYNRPSFLAFLAIAYNDVYGWNKLDQIFQSPYNETVLQLFDGSKTTGEIDSQLPKSVNLLFTSTFLNGLSNGEARYFVNALLDNTLLDWMPLAPITLIHGSNDQEVPYTNATITKSALLSNGAHSVDLYTIEGGTHSSSVMPAIEYTINWFNTFRAGSFKKVQLVR
jgi:predicted esterase